MADKNIFYPVHTPEIDEDVENYLGENGYFSANLPYFKFRQGQLDMAKAWQSCLKESNILVSEAGTGTGKTYLIWFRHCSQEKNSHLHSLKGTAGSAG